MPRRGYLSVENDFKNGFCPVVHYPIAHLEIIYTRGIMIGHTTVPLLNANIPAYGRAGIFVAFFVRHVQYLCINC
jgi:hypothetical protein